MTEWADHGGRKLLDAIREKNNPAVGRAGMDEGMREEIMRRALEELESSSEQINEKQAREMIIQSIAETRGAVGQKVDLPQIEKMIDRIGREIEDEKELERQKEEALRQEKQLRKEHRMPWYLWVIIALALMPLLLVGLRIGALVAARIARVMF